MQISLKLRDISKMKIGSGTNGPAAAQREEILMGGLLFALTFLPQKRKSRGNQPKRGTYRGERQGLHPVGAARFTE